MFDLLPGSGSGFLEIISWNFLLFVIITLAVYYILNRKAQNIWLLATSIFFIGSWGWQYLIPLTVTGGLTFLIGKKLTGPNSHRVNWAAAPNNGFDPDGVTRQFPFLPVTSDVG
jgi:hypothetical protein